MHISVLTTGINRSNNFCIPMLKHTHIYFFSFQKLTCWSETSSDVLLLIDALLGEKQHSHQKTVTKHESIWSKNSHMNSWLSMYTDGLQLTESIFFRHSTNWINWKVCSLNYLWSCIIPKKKTLSCRHTFYITTFILD